MGFSDLGSKKVTTKLAAPTGTLKEKADSKKVTKANKSELQETARNLKFIAYDKKTNSAKETFFIDNGSETSLSALELEISYFNQSGKQIHKRKVEINQLLPSKETRKVDITSWDTQKSFHYVNSVPSKKGSTPYTVRFRVLSFIPYKTD